MRINQMNKGTANNKEVKTGGGNMMSHKKPSQIEVEPMFDDEVTDLNEEQQKEETIGEILIKLEYIDDDSDTKDDIEIHNELKKESPKDMTMDMIKRFMMILPHLLRETKHLELMMMCQIL